MAKKNDKGVAAAHKANENAAGAVPLLDTEEFATDTNVTEVRRKNAKSKNKR